MNLLIVWLVVTTVIAVKEELFKTCAQSGFCSRQRHYASHVSAPHYSLRSPQIGESEVSAIVRKEWPGHQVDFSITIQGVIGNQLRVIVDEDRSKIDSGLVNPRRYNETGNWAFKQGGIKLEPFTSVGVNGDKLTIEYGSNSRMDIDVNTFKLGFSHHGRAELVVNGENWLNIEHYRTSSDDLMDAESDFDMFSDSFADSKDDTMPLGPESIGLDFSFVGHQHLYGLPEHADSFRLDDTSDGDPFRLFNVDIFEYDTDSRMPMYGSIPFVLAPGKSSVGVFWVNAADTWVDIAYEDDDSRAHFMSENGVIDFIVTMEDSPALVNKQFSEVVGTTMQPPMFSLGYHQCRWNYNDEVDVLDINAKFDEHEIPYDTIWLDVEYAIKKHYFTWQPEKFPNPGRMAKKLDRTGRNLVVIIDPHLATGYFASDELMQEGYTMKDNKGETYKGHCWPGESIWIDTLDPDSQKYWNRQFTNFMSNYTTSNVHIWNDMNEPSVFNGPETTAPKDNLHYGNWEHRSIHNIYGISYHEATHKALQSPAQRPFILTRSFYAGSQRTAAMWFGDNLPTWDHLRISIPMVLSHNIANYPFVGVDIGGFFGNPSSELLTRWYQASIFYPFMRAHAHIDSVRREPWVAGGVYSDAMREAIRMRYTMLPIWYTCFRDSTKTGEPVIKPLFYEVDDVKVMEIDDQFFVGNSGIMAKPVTVPDATEVKMYIPEGPYKYVDFTNGEIGRGVFHPGSIATLQAPLDAVPMVIRQGSAFFRKMRYRRSSRLMQLDPYTLTVVYDDEHHAKGSLYVDDGVSYQFEQGEYAELEVVATESEIRVHKVGGSNDFLASVAISIDRLVVVDPAFDDITDVSISDKPVPFSVTGGVVYINTANFAVPFAIEIRRTVADEL